MTDRYSSLTVVLEKDIREDDAKALIAAIQQLRGVLTVEGNVANLSEFVIEQRVRQEFREKLWEVLR
jgi:inosine-uridine nucleoside N-ribohydrolase